MSRNPDPVPSLFDRNVVIGWEHVHGESVLAELMGVFGWDIAQEVSVAVFEEIRSANLSRNETEDWRVGLVSIGNCYLLVVPDGSVGFLGELPDGWPVPLFEVKVSNEDSFRLDYWDGEFHSFCYVTGGELDVCAMSAQLEWNHRGVLENTSDGQALVWPVRCLLNSVEREEPVYARFGERLLDNLGELGVAMERLLAFDSDFMKLIIAVDTCLHTRQPS